MKDKSPVSNRDEYFYIEWLSFVLFKIVKGIYDG